MENKTALRTKIKTLRKSFDLETLSNKITEKILVHSAFNEAKNVMIYYPMRYEINLLRLLSADKNFYFPKVSGEDLFVCPNCSEFKVSGMNIQEPCSNPVSPEVLDLIIVPALAVDKENYRLGYGGGFYDRFLSNHPNIKTLVPISKEFIFEKLPREEFDVPVDFVVTD